MSVNKVMLIGRLGQNPELRYTPSGAAVANFSVATNENWTDKSGQKQERTEWHRIVVWGKVAELCNQYLSKGRQVFVEGRLQTRQWQDQSGQNRYTTEVHAQTVQFLGAQGAGQGQGAPAPGPSQDFGPGPGQSAPGMQGLQQSDPVAAPPANAAGAEGEGSFTEDDIPF